MIVWWDRERGEGGGGGRYALKMSLWRRIFRASNDFFHLFFFLAFSGMDG